jgi:hypothetical protein
MTALPVLRRAGALPGVLITDKSHDPGCDTQQRTSALVRGEIGTGSLTLAVKACFPGLKLGYHPADSIERRLVGQAACQVFKSIDLLVDL